MKPHDVAGVETTGLSIPLSSVVIRSGAGLTPRPHSHREPGRRAPACRGRFDALKCRRVLERDANWPGRGRHRSTVLDLKAPRDATHLEGFNIPRRVRSGPQEMRIPPLRSAVQMGSDVSPGSSVTLGRRVSSDAHR